MRMRHSEGLGNLSVDFANTEACPACRVGDALASFRAAMIWRRFRPDLPPIARSAATLTSLRGFRDDLRSVFAATIGKRRPPDPLVDRLNRSLRSAPSHLEVRVRLGQLTLLEVQAYGAPENLWISAIVRSTFEVIGAAPPHQLRRCQGPGCVHYVIARTNRQLWCSPTGCGNRVRVARHYWKER